MKHSEYSAVIIGSGVAGLYAALKISRNINLPDGVLLLTKTNLQESNSRYAQGGIVAVIKDNKLDSVETHIKDTVNAGAGLTDRNVTKYISEISNDVIGDLIDLGVGKYLTPAISSNPVPPKEGETLVKITERKHGFTK